MTRIRTYVGVPALAAALSLAASSVVALGQNCTSVTATCDGWGATNPKVAGFCCTAKFAKAAACTSGVASVTVDPDGNCGRFAAITGSNCGNQTATGCGSASSVLGCTSVNCGGA
jgi:hypothetical protein